MHPEITPVERVTLAEAMEAAKNHNAIDCAGSGSCFACIMARYILSAPAPSCDAEWFEKFVLRVMVETAAHCSASMGGKPDLDQSVKKFTAELASKFAGRSDDEIKPCPKCRNSLQNATPHGSPKLLRCASCKTVFDWRTGITEPAK